MGNSADQRVFVPQGIPDLFSILRKRPDCLVWAGGTFAGISPLARLETASRDLVSLQRIEELKRVFRTDRYLELGATVTLERVLRLSPRFVPQSLRQAILSTVPAPARSLATIGGNFCLPEDFLNLVPWAATIDARIELRRFGAVRFVPASRFVQPGGQPDLEPGELLTRVRIPIGRWNHQLYRRVGGHHEGFDDGAPLAFCGLAEAGKGLIDELRIGYAFSNSQVYFFPSLDAEWVGRRLPLSGRDIESYATRVAAELLPLAPAADRLLAWRLDELIRGFFRELNRSAQ